MKKLLLIAFVLLMVACSTKKPIPIPDTQDQFDIWVQAEDFVRQEERKEKTLWMYSTGSFGLLALGLAILAFSPVRRLSGLIFVAGGLVGMASVWVFDSEWFPWIAGTTVGTIMLISIGFAVKKLFFPSPECDNVARGKDGPQT